MQKITLISIVVYLFALASCGEKKKGKTLSLADKIKTAEAKIDVNKPIDRKNLLLLTDLYNKYVDSLPKDPKSPVYLIKAGDFYGTLQMQDKKCDQYKNLLTKYPDFKDADMVMYLLASAYDSDLNNRTEAKKYYQLYVEKYPNSIYVGDAKSRLTTIDSLSFKELEDMIIHRELEGSK
jgi:outer membrane protein assembly factor BamD (BamD/ComL family)